jgi:hypothetical protein
MVVAIDRATGYVDMIESKDHAWQMRRNGMCLHVPAPEQWCLKADDRDA